MKLLFKEATSSFDYFSLMRIRALVFMKEQNVDPLLEIDNDDTCCKHFIVFADDQIVATCRIIEYQDYYKIGRFAVLKEYRTRKVGTFLLHQIKALALDNKKTKLVLSAQVTAIPFYEKNGFIVTSEPYFDANIVHRDMELIL